MEERTDILKKYVGVVWLFGVAVIVTVLFILGCNWMNQTDPQSEKVTPNDFFCAMGQPLEKEVALSVTRSEEIWQAEQSVSGMTIGYVIGKVPELDLLYQMYQIYAGSMEARKLREKTELLVIPENANAIESPAEKQKLDSALEMAGIFDFLNADMRLYAWNVEKTKRSGTQIKEIHVVICFNGWILIGTSTAEGNHRFQVDIRYGNYAEILSTNLSDMV